MALWGGDVGDPEKLIPANGGIRSIDDCKAKLVHELSDCLQSIAVLPHKYGTDLEVKFSETLGSQPDMYLASLVHSKSLHSDEFGDALRHQTHA